MLTRIVDWALDNRWLVLSALVALVKERLAGTTVISIGHRPTLGAFHTRRLVVRPNGDQAATLEEAKASA